MTMNNDSGIVIGDPPAYLNCRIGTTVDIVCVDGKAYDKDAVAKLLAERDALAVEVDEANERVAEVAAERDALAAKVKNLENELRQRKLIHVGFTNETQVQFVTEHKQDGEFCPSSEDGCYIPLYMLDVHAHRVGSDSEIYKEHCELWKQRKQIAEIRAEAGRAGFIAGCHCGANYNIHDWDSIADEYAAKVRQGGE